MKHFSIQESIKFGWDTMRKHSAIVFQVVLTILALQVLQAIVSHTISGSGLGFIATVVILVLQFFVGIGATRIALKLSRGTHAVYADLMPPWELAWRYFLASALVALIVVCGLILLVIPGIYFLLRYSMVRFAVVDGAKVMDALSHSADMTRGVKWHLLGFFVVLILLNIVGAIALLVGLLVTMPISMLATAHVYLKLKGHHTH